jgi:hypothetical protein
MEVVASTDRRVDRVRVFPPETADKGSREQAAEEISEQESES